jgi:hypothetical protein
MNFSGGTTVYIRQTNSTFEYSTDQTIWNELTFPVDVNNIDTESGLLKIEFTTDLTLSSPNDYFNCVSEYIQFGSTSLKNDGTRPIIHIDFDNFDGFIQNGTNTLPGFSNVFVYNLQVDATGHDTQIGAGWIGKSTFGNSATNNYIVNCSSSGNLPDGIGSGGIVGSYAGSNNGILYIYGCSSSGTIGLNCGGIVGSNAGDNSGNVTCDKCWTTGEMRYSCGGIFGSNAGYFGTVLARNCYSTGIIGNSAGGIYGPSASNAVAENCYSTGTIDENAGGIFGIFAGSNNGVSSASNCYTLGSTIFGVSAQPSTIETNCYSANDYWNDSDANLNLVGIPSSIENIWLSYISNTPYLLNNYGYTPYSINNINSLNSQLVQTFTQSIQAGQTTIPAIVSGKSYSILSITSVNPSSHSTITIDNDTGVISTTNQTSVGTYTIGIKNDGSYNITTFILTIEPSVPCLTENTTVLTPNGYIHVQELRKGDYIIDSNNKIQPIKNIFETSVSSNKFTNPYLIPKHSISEGYPSMDTTISGNHLILFQDKWIHPILSGKFQQQTTTDKMIKYYHIELNNYETDNLVINNGLIVESLSGFNNEVGNQIYFQRIINNYKCTVVYENDNNQHTQISLSSEIRCE